MNITIIADASFCPDEHVAGYGFWIASQRGKLGGGGKCIDGGRVDSSTAAEMMAVCDSIHQAIEARLVQPQDSVLVQTDCMAAIQAFQGLRTNLPVQERNAVKYMQQLTKELALTFMFKHVKGHSGILDARSITNKLCDERAKKAMRIARNVSKARKLKQTFIEGNAV